MELGDVNQQWFREEKNKDDNAEVDSQKTQGGRAQSMLLLSLPGAKGRTSRTGTRMVGTTDTTVSLEIA